MNGSWLILFCSLLLFLGYRLYGSRVARRFGVNPQRPTPAHTRQDGQDYVPTHPAVVFGHHFASIAGAAPIIGPITAISYGWVPALAWIVFGGIFLGAVHDFSALMASLRHDGKGIGDIIEEHIGRKAKVLFLIFTWLTLILVLAVFASIVAKGFVASPQSAGASVYFVILAILFGWALFKRWASFKTLSGIGILGIIVAIWLGFSLPVSFSTNHWLIILFLYVFIASILPVWLLLQPRDYLSAFLLYGMLAIGTLSALIASPEIHMPAWGALYDNPLGPVFPFLFVTIACGAISGFHSIVASGTTARQLNAESDAQPVAFGAMLVETLLAVLALVTAARLLPEQHANSVKTAGPIAVFSSALADFSAKLGIPSSPVLIFATLTVSAFALTTLDSATRLARYTWEELFRGTSTWLSNKWSATLISVLSAAWLAATDLWKQIWPLFGSANQLLAALALLAIYVWMRRQKRGGLFFLFLPMLFMYAVTSAALGHLVWKSFTATAVNWIIGPVAFILLVLSLILLILGIRSIKDTLHTPSS